MIRPILLAATVLSLAACASQQVAEVKPLDGTLSGQCHTDSVRGAVGLAVTGQSLERARVDSDSLQVRTVRAGEGTASSQAGETGGDRLTVETGQYHQVVALHCG